MVRRPVPLLAVSLVILLALSAIATTMKISYDDRKGQIAAKRRWDAERKALVAADGRK